jgi:L-ascorbate metabolism protein UlaG (beta-lactamase superfamily)
MKITKLGHSCLLVEMPNPTNRTALFDPGIMSTVDVDSLEYLDDIIITHSHSDHFDIDLIKKLVAKFPGVHITAPDDVVEQLNTESIAATSAASEGIDLFESPHEYGAPLIPKPPLEIGVHYLDMLSHPGDSHSFTETKQVLALPVQAPWGSTLNAVRLATELKPKVIIPVHDWHWRDEARQQAYDRLEQLFTEQGIIFIKPVSGEPFVLEL